MNGTTKTDQRTFIASAKEPLSIKTLISPGIPGSILSAKRLRRTNAIESFHMDSRSASSFQHCSAGPSTFEDAKRAAFDADRALALAKDLRQTTNTPIFFGVDFNAQANDMPNVRQYFKIVSERLKDKFRVGVYGNGLTCETLRQDNSEILCWVSQSATYWQSKTLIDERRYDIKQCLNRQPWKGSKTDFDPDVFNDDRPIKFWTRDGH